VAWERRKRGGRYYTRSRRSPKDGRVLREYVGSGPLAEIAAEEDHTKRELAEAERKREKTELERLEALAAPVNELSEAAEILAHAHLIAAGYHRHKGEYRRARGER
jgi:crotonobetainyl-CoA:carnitine CoA-transferase CaiB-like acyl-CoA transferase